MGTRVLVVEDHALVAESIRMVLEQKGMEVEVESDGLNGYARAVQRSYDLLILDVDLPMLDGLQLCTKLRSELGNSTPVIMLTGRTHGADQIAGLDAGADIYMTKPFEGTALLQAVASLVPGANTHARH